MTQPAHTTEPEHPWRKITRHHVRAIRLRLALRGESVRQLAARAGVSSSTLYGLLQGQQVGSKHLTQILAATGIDPDATREQLQLETQFIEAVKAVVANNNAGQLRLAIATLEALAAM